MAHPPCQFSPVFITRGVPRRHNLKESFFFNVLEDLQQAPAWKASQEISHLCKLSRSNRGQQQESQLGKEADEGHIFQ
jgi:hypothetical protein